MQRIASLEADLAAANRFSFESEIGIAHAIRFAPGSWSVHWHGSAALKGYWVLESVPRDAALARARELAKGGK
jgi:hypothetical protein